jgi:hypothetical protein
VQIDEFFYNGSLQTFDAYFMEHEAFSKEWMDLQAFLHKVHPLYWQIPLLMKVIFKSLCWIAILIVFFVMQHKPDHTWAFKGVANKGIGVDLMIFDIPENLPIPNMSNLPSSIPDWNQMHKDLLVSVFDFVGGHVHDDGVLLLFFPDDLKLKETLQGYMEAYHFSFEVEGNFARLHGGLPLLSLLRMDRSQSVETHKCHGCDHDCKLYKSFLIL